MERRLKDSCLSLCSSASSHLAVLLALHHQSMCQFEGSMRRLIDILLATRHGNFLLCVCVSLCACVRVCVCMYGCERMFERMLMSIAECLSPFFSQWTGCSQGKRKTHEAFCPLPTSNVPACMRTCTRTHTHTQFLLLLQLFCAPLCPLFLFHVSRVAGLD